MKKLLVATGSAVITLLGGAAAAAGNLMSPRPNPVLSGLTAEQTTEAISKRMPLLEGCIREALTKDPKLDAGQIDVVIHVGADGKVLSATVQPKKHAGAEWALCLVEKVKPMVLPKSDSETEVQVSLRISAPAEQGLTPPQKAADKKPEPKKKDASKQ